MHSSDVKLEVFAVRSLLVFMKVMGLKVQARMNDVDVSVRMPYSPLYGRQEKRADKVWREKAWAIRAYPCFETFKFIDLYTAEKSIYADVL